MRHLVTPSRSRAAASVVEFMQNVRGSGRNTSRELLRSTPRVGSAVEVNDVRFGARVGVRGRMGAAGSEVLCRWREQSGS